MNESNEIFYPLSKIKENKRDIALIELQNAQNLSNNQTKIYYQFTKILLGIVAIGLPVFLNIETQLGKNIFNENFIIIAFLLFLIGLLLLRYFVDLQKEITINARKVVTLRTMLGLDYTSIKLTLPKNRIEGATNPFNIKFFNGWYNFQTSPFWIITSLTCFIWTLNFYSIDIDYLYKNNYTLFDYIDTVWLLGLSIILSSYFYCYRVNLFDRNENLYLHIGIFFSWMLKIKLLKNFEYSLYRARLSHNEMIRLNINCENLERILIKIEDESFYRHKGVNIKSIFRAIFSQFEYTRKKFKLIPSGGSTITMQLARTIYIPSNQKKYKRKILELFISLWLNKVLNKKETLYIYIASVRYGYKIMGITDALKIYFKIENIENYKLSNEQAFFLVERLSNISGKADEERIKFLLKKIDSDINKTELEKLYKYTIGQIINLNQS